MECATKDYFRFLTLSLRHLKVSCIIFLIIAPVYGCSTSKVQIPDAALVSEQNIPKIPIVSSESSSIDVIEARWNFALEANVGDLNERQTIIDIIEAKWNVTPRYEYDHETEESISLTDDIAYIDKHHEEETIGFPTFHVYEPELIEDPLIEDNCVDSAFSWCDPRYENEYLAYLEHEKDQRHQAAIFPNFISPVDEGLILRGIRLSTGKRRGHYGLDIIPRARKRGGVPIKAVKDGIIVRVLRARGYGYYTVIYHQNGIFSLYAHLSKKKRMKAGQKVNRGDTIAFMGKSGNARGYHLHFELIDLRKNWNLTRSIDEFVEKLYQKSQITRRESDQFGKLLFAKQAKQDPLPNIPGLALAKRVNGKWGAVESASQTQAKNQKAKKK